MMARVRGFRDDDYNEHLIILLLNWKKIFIEKASSQVSFSVEPPSF